MCASALICATERQAVLSIDTVGHDVEGELNGLQPNFDDQCGTARLRGRSLLALERQRALG